MVEVLRWMVSVVNQLRDFLLLAVRKLGLRLDDKQLHFWVLGLIGIALFVAVDAAFRWVSKWSVSAISFIYTMSMLVIVALAMEIQQQITRRGALDFNDILAGIWGFVTLFCLYLLVRMAVHGGLIVRKKMRESRGSRQGRRPPEGK
jgi:hypothetical protein